MKTIFIIASVAYVIVAHCYLAYSAPLYWAKTYEGIDNEVNCMQIASDGKLLSAGYKKPSEGEHSGFWVFKQDSTGNILWEKTYGAVETAYARAIQQILDGNYVAAGKHGPTDMLIVKLDGDGTIIWQKTYYISNNFYVSSLIKTSDGGCIVTGGIYSPGIWQDIFIMKLDNNGNVEWIKQYGRANDEDEDAYYDPSAIIETEEGNYAVVGTASLFGYSDVFVMSIDSNGDIIWQKGYGTFYNEFAESIVQTNDDGLIIACCQGYGQRLGNLWLLKLDGDGTIVWQKVYMRENPISLYSFNTTVDDGFIGSGYSFHGDDVDTWIIRLDNNGNVIWDKEFIGIDEDNIAFSLQTTSDNGYIVASEIIFDDFSKNTLLLKLDSMGAIPGCDMFQSNSVSVSNTTSSSGEADFIVSSLATEGIDRNYDAQDASTQVSVICCYDSEDNDNDCVAYAEDNCPDDFNPLQEDLYPPQSNSIGDACDCEGNFNCAVDQDVDGSDAALFKTDFGRSSIERPCIAGDTCNGDFNCDGDVDGTDASLFKSDFGRSSMQNPCPGCTSGVAWCMYQ